MSSLHASPSIALVGRQNVGKSSIFNRLTRTKSALVADFAGLTRDYKIGKCCIKDQTLNVIDTGVFTRFRALHKSQGKSKNLANYQFS